MVEQDLTNEVLEIVKSMAKSHGIKQDWLIVQLYEYFEDTKDNMDIGTQKVFLETIQKINNKRYYKKLKSISNFSRWFALFSISHIHKDFTYFHPKLRKLIVKKLDDVNSEVRFWAIRVIGKFQLKETIPQLMLRLRKDRNSKVRSQSAWSLGLLGDESAKPNLIVSMKTDKNSQVRLYAEKALILLEKKGSIKEIEASLVAEINQRMTEDDLRALTKVQKREFREESWFAKHGGEIIIGLIALVGIVLQLVLK